MIGQEFALPYLIFLAIEHLQKDLFAEGDYYPGDLLKSVLTVNTSFWPKHPSLWASLNALINNRRDELAAEGISTADFDSGYQ